MLLVQVVEILWTKATRGAPRSNSRAALPRFFEFSGSGASCIVQYYRLAEWSAFAPQLFKQESLHSPPSVVGVLKISVEGAESVSLGISGTPNLGQPKRFPIPTAIELRSGQSARIILNARHTSYSGQHYSETVYNVALGDELSGVRHLRTVDHLLDLRQQLF